MTSAELQAYPDSLLSSLAASCTTSDAAGGDSSSSSTVSINLDDVPGWPRSLLNTDEAALVMNSLYRYASCAQNRDASLSLNGCAALSQRYRFIHVVVAALQLLLP
jgi:hypothetical protein